MNPMRSCRRIFAHHCLMGGRQLTHTEKDGAAAKLCWVGVLLKAVVRPLLTEKG